MLIGMDILDVNKIQIIEAKDSILNRLYTPIELNSVIKLNYRRRIMTLACIYAAKEAAVKALGTGFNDDIGVQDIQIIMDAYNRGKVDFLARAKELANKLGVTKAHLALGIEKRLVIAMVVLEIH